MPSAITIFAVPADMAGAFRGGSRLHLATLHSGRAERSAGSPIRSFFRSPKKFGGTNSEGQIIYLAANSLIFIFFVPEGLN